MTRRPLAVYQSLQPVATNCLSVTDRQLVARQVSYSSVLLSAGSAASVAATSAVGASAVSLAASSAAGFSVLSAASACLLYTSPSPRD